jgi:hypothetical protein
LLNRAIKDQSRSLYQAVIATIKARFITAADLMLQLAAART